jgi:hypothetical protein
VVYLLTLDSAYLKEKYDSHNQSTMRASFNTVHVVRVPEEKNTFGESSYLPEVHMYVWAASNNDVCWDGNNSIVDAWINMHEYI